MGSELDLSSSQKSTVIDVVESVSLRPLVESHLFEERIELI
jgi:hypothetical protein